MIENVYIENDILEHFKTKEILSKLGNVNIIVCDKYTEIFNKKSQNFRLQKKKPSLILAKKYGNFILKTPANFSIGGNNNYYFSHMLNCIYDCKYCFLQGMFNSANYILFTNYDDFKNEIIDFHKKKKSEKLFFFSGYDCDSLALEPITNFAEYFINLFSSFKNSFLELRTKSSQVNFLLNQKINQNIIVAFSLNPDSIIKIYESKTPSLKKRLNAIKKLQEKEWEIGLRFDPVIYCENFKQVYKDFFRKVFSSIKSNIHSVTLGSFRMPNLFNKKLIKLYPNDSFFQNNLQKENNFITYEKQINRELLFFCKKEILKYLDSNKLFIN